MSVVCEVNEIPEDCISVLSSSKLLKDFLAVRSALENTAISGIVNNYDKELASEGNKILNRSLYDGCNEEVFVVRDAKLTHFVFQKSRNPYLINMANDFQTLAEDTMNIKNWALQDMGQIELVMLYWERRVTIFKSIFSGEILQGQALLKDLEPMLTPLDF